MPESQPPEPPEPREPPEPQEGEEKAEEELEDLNADASDEEITERVRGGRSRAISIPY